MDILRHTVSLANGVLTMKIKVLDLSDPAATAAAIPGTDFLQYVVRCQMGNTIYYAAMSMTPTGAPIFYVGKAQSVDLCSVSACFPHVITYPEPGFRGGNAEIGSVSCPASPSKTNPCDVTIHVNAADVGHPTATSLLEEVGAYSLASSHLQGRTTNAQALADNVPLEIDGLCCINFRAS